MIFIVITAVLIAFSYEPPSNPRQITATGVALLAAGAFLLINWLVGELAARWSLRRLIRPGQNRSAVLCRYQQLRWAHAGVLLGGYTGLIHGFDWPGVVRVSWGLGRWILVDDLLILAPVVVAILLAALAQFQVEEFMREHSDSLWMHPPRWKSRWDHIDFQFRHHMGIVLLPLLVMMGIQDTIGLLFENQAARSSIELAAALTGLGVILVFAPMLLRFLWGAQPLPQGPLRARLERLSRRLRFRSTDILIWNTHGAVINAAVAGILPWPRYVLLSDALLTNLSADEVEAVFGHEVGHVRHHHLWFFIAFLAGATTFLIVSMSAVASLIDSFVGESARGQAVEIVQGLVMPSACLALYFGLFFGFLSRRFERQADIFGCRAVSCSNLACPTEHAPESWVAGDPPLCPAGIEIFVQALEKVAILNGAIREARSWRHFSIAKRVEFLSGLASEPRAERTFQRIVFLLKILVIVALAGGIWTAWQHSPEAAQQVLRP